MLKDSFCENWEGQFERDDLVSLGLYLTFQLSNLLQKKETEVAEIAGIMIDKSDRYESGKQSSLKLVRSWRVNKDTTGELVSCGAMKI